MVSKERRMGCSMVSLLIFYLINLVSTFNVDVAKAHLYTTKSPVGDYFGYSISFHRNKLIVGAPLSNETNHGTYRWGSVFECDYKARGQKACTLLGQVDKLGSSASKLLDAEIANRENQWMGATVYSNAEMIMACAPRYKTKSSGVVGLNGKCDIIFPFDAFSSASWRPCTELAGKSSKIYGFCQSGFSARLYGSSYLQMMTGVPMKRAQIGVGLYASSGGVGVPITTSGGNKFTTEKGIWDIYRGYAVTTGKFSKTKEIVFISGAPRGDLISGNVVMHKVDDLASTFGTTITDPSKQFGSYFGAALAAADINNDGFSDLVVGAPYYSGATYNEGALYVYINDGNDGLKYVQALYGKETPESGALYGLAIGSVGDLNQDGYADIAVGAPWGGKSGNGMVFLYYGSSDKVSPLQLKQTIEPEDFGGTAGTSLKGFGYSFTEYYPYGAEKPGRPSNDIDLNKFPDIGIGSFRSGHVVLLRSRPVLTITGTLTLGNIKKIDLASDKNLCQAEDKKTYKCLKDVKICFNIANQQLVQIDKADVTYTLSVDVNQKRAKRAVFTTSKGVQHQHTETAVLTVNPGGCKTYTIYIKKDTTDIFREIVFELTWDIKVPTTCTEICTVSNKLEALRVTALMPFVRGCSSDGNEICNSNLEIKSMTARKTDKTPVNTISVGETKLVTVDIEIKNYQENAFHNTLTVAYPQGLGTNKVSSDKYDGTVQWNTVENVTLNKLTVTLTSPIKKSETVNVVIIFSVLNVKDTGTLKLDAEVTTESTEMAPINNKRSLSLSVVYVADVIVTGNVVPEQITWKSAAASESIVGPIVKHNFLFQNKGPSSVAKSEIVINFPDQYKGKYFLNLIGVNLKGSGADSPGLCTFGDLNILKLQIKNNTKKVSSRKRRTAQTKELACGSGATCREIKCSLGFLQKHQSVSVTLTSTLVEYTFEKVIRDSRTISVTSKFTTTAAERTPGAPPDTATVNLAIISPHLTKSGGSDTIAWWIILLCVLAAIIIIGLIVFVMYKKGFFKRKKYDDEGGEKDERDALRNGDE